MAGYVAFDHVAWMGQAGLVTNTSLLKTFQKASLYSWFIGSLCSICTQRIGVGFERDGWVRVFRLSVFRCSRIAHGAPFESVRGGASESQGRDPKTAPSTSPCPYSCLTPGKTLDHTLM